MILIVNGHTRTICKSPRCYSTRFQKKGPHYHINHGWWKGIGYYWSVVEIGKDALI